MGEEPICRDEIGPGKISGQPAALLKNPVWSAKLPFPGIEGFLCFLMCFLIGRIFLLCSHTPVAFQDAVCPQRRSLCIFPADRDNRIPAPHHIPLLCLRYPPLQTGKKKLPLFFIKMMFHPPFVQGHQRIISASPGMQFKHQAIRQEMDAAIPVYADFQPAFRLSFPKPHKLRFRTDKTLPLPDFREPHFINIGAGFISAMQIPQIQAAILLIDRNGKIRAIPAERNFFQSVFHTLLLFFENSRPSLAGRNCSPALLNGAAGSFYNIFLRPDKC